GRSERPHRRRAGKLWALVMAVAVLTGAGGCRRAGPRLTRRVVVDPAALVVVHPGWARVRDLDRKIARLSAAKPAYPQPLFSPPPPAPLERVEVRIGRINPEQRLRMGEVIRQRVRRDFEARSGLLQRRAQRKER